MKRSKRYKAFAEKIDADKQYTLEEAIALVKESPVKFDAGVEVHMNLGIDPSKSDQIVRSTIVLPHGTGKTKRVAAFVTPEMEEEAKKAGADVIGTQAVIDEIKKTGKCDFDVAVGEPKMMRNLGPIAKTLGQQGLMPSPKTETVGSNIGEMVEALKKGKETFRNDKGANVHMLVGRVSYDAAKLTENINAFVEEVKASKPEDSKGTFIKSMTLTASMGPGIKVAV